MKVEVLTDSSVNVSWSVNGLTNISEFAVSYRQTDDDGDHRQMVVIVPSSASSVVLTLVSGRQYSISVSARTLINGISVSGYGMTYSFVFIFSRGQNSRARKFFIFNLTKVKL